MTLALNQRVYQFEGMLRQALSEYNLHISSIDTKSIKFMIEMQDQVKEHLAEVTIQDSTSKNHPNKLYLHVEKSVSEKFSQTLYFRKDCLDDQAPVYKNLLQRIFKAPQKKVFFISLGEIVNYYTTDFHLEGIKIETSYEEGVLYIRYKSEEANVLLISISREDELRNDMLYSMNHIIQYSQSINNLPVFKVFKQNLFPQQHKEFELGFIGWLGLDGFVNNNNQVLENIISILPNEYTTQRVNLDQIQFDFRLGANTKFFKLKTLNGQFIFCSTYFEDEEKIGKFELRIFTIDDFYTNNFKLQQKDNIKTLQFYRMQTNDFNKLMVSLNFDVLLNTLGYEISQMYIEEISNTQYHKLYADDQFDNESQSTEFQPFKVLPRLTLRKVITADQNNNDLYTFKYSCLSGYVTLEINDKIHDDNYQLDFHAVNYSKEWVRKFLETSLSLNKRIQEA